MFQLGMRCISTDREEGGPSANFIAISLCRRPDDTLDTPGDIADPPGFLRAVHQQLQDRQRFVGKMISLFLCRAIA